MNQFLFTQGNAEELTLFPHIIELGVVKNSAMHLNAFQKVVVPGVKIFYILDGKFNWNIHNIEHTLYPGDVALILPGQEIGSTGGILEIGSFCFLHFNAYLKGTGEIVLDKCGRLSGNEITAMSKILLLSSPVVITQINEAGKILKCIQQELCDQEFGYHTSVNNRIDELLILLTRHLTRQKNPGRDFPKTFMKLEEALRKDISHQWTVDEMAALVGLGNTLFNDTVKNYTGFTPLNYLINIRISEAIRLLKKSHISIINIALDTGFNSSQHFSTTFKKLTGFTPGEFRKNNSYNE
ncbi:MAG: AraC family transcriptional regulator [Ferruginibacter sp.]